jgi:hypothetical protein
MSNSRIVGCAGLLLILFSLIGSFNSSGQEKAGPYIAFSPFSLNGFDGAESGTLQVPENRVKSFSRNLELAVVRLKCKAANPGVPVVFLSGGPGGSAIAETNIPFYAQSVSTIAKNPRCHLDGSARHGTLKASCLLAITSASTA